MSRNEASASRPIAVLPAPEVLRWTILAVAPVVAACAWLAAVLWLPGFLGSTAGQGSEPVRSAVAAAVPVILFVGAAYTFGRARMERLAQDPGPMLILPFKDYVEGSGKGSRDGERLQAVLQQHLLATRLYSATAIPSPGRSTNFINVIEPAAESTGGIASIFMRLVRFVAPVSSYEVQCTMFRTSDESGPDAGRCTLLVELTRAPRHPLTPETFVEETWEDAVSAAAVWLATVVLPSTRISREPPWTLWQGRALPPDLLAIYLRFQRHRDAGRLDEAMEAIDDALRLDPTNLGLALERGKLEEQLGMELEALATYSWIVGQAARRDRRLAYLWFGPPTEDQEVPPRQTTEDDDTDTDTRTRADDGTGPRTEPGGALTGLRLRNRAWHFRPQGVPGLDPWHPVVYVARYRYCLLLGSGRTIAEQWWDVEPHGQVEPGVGQRSPSARRSSRREARRNLRDRLVDRHGTRPGELAHRLQSEKVRSADGMGRSAISTTAVDFLGEPDQADQPDQADVPDLIGDAAIFLTSLGVWETEHLIAERPPLPPRPGALHDLSMILPRRSLQLILPRAILLKALCVDRVHRERDSEENVRTALVERAAASMVFPLNEPVLEPRLTGLLASGWPADLFVVEEWVNEIMRPGRRVLGSWHEHYNVACVLSLLLRENEGYEPEMREYVSRAAVSELEKAVARGYTTAVSAQSDWILNEDPDLAELRGTEAFDQFERLHLGFSEGRLDAGYAPAKWHQHTAVNDHLRRYAEHRRAIWAARATGEHVDRSDAVAWLSEEASAWDLVRTLVRGYDDWRTRLRTLRAIRSATAGESAGAPAAIPSSDLLYTQVVALAPEALTGKALGNLVTDARTATVAQSAIDAVVRSSRERLDGVHALFGRKWHVAPVEAGHRPARDAVAPWVAVRRARFPGRGDIDGAAVHAGFRSLEMRWAGLGTLFDDTTGGRTGSHDQEVGTPAARVSEFERVLENADTVDDSITPGPVPR